MSLYENTVCPVCGKAFEEGDDIVVCPECGTPHHRECYGLAGHCVNEGLHQSGYSFYEDHKPVVNPPEENQYYTPGENQNGFFGSAPKDGEEKSGPFFFSDDTPIVDRIYERDNQTIDGERVADYAAAIRTNAPRFINKFKELEYHHKKVSWNWGAFLFGSLYYFFRKIHKQGVLFFCIACVITAVRDFLIIKLAPKYLAAVSEIANLYVQNKMDDAMARMQEVAKLSDTRTAELILVIFFAVLLVVRIIEALFADVIYKSTVSSMIKSVKSQFENGELVQPSLFAEQSAELSGEQLKQLYLARKGGVSFLAPMTALLLYYILLTYI